ncbi:hypothetical protein H0H81_006618 [Sphagnurus paluster]|uniref:GH16 domain-containing protein n=1 Tax=Sphagnurus paluster TaxID=117069 RepID=A0A9P7KIV3_9AGAR|nr:hypothetical protein H0H81_006618 [Sphagnurus paluster]
MLLFKSLPLGLILLISDASPTSAILLPRSLQKIHGVAVKHTKSLARDLRVAFGGILVSQEPNPNNPSGYTVYCKPGNSGSPGGLGGSSGNTTSQPTPSLRPSSTSGAGSSSPSTSTSSSQTAQPSTGNLPTSSPWQLTQTYQGNNFYNGWDFFTGSDPTNGIVQYVDQATGTASGILSINANGNAVMRVETTPSVPNTRQSIRITTQASFTGGLVIMDAVHIPTGCGVWPAFWTNGPNWPAGGEIDIVEGVNDYTNNQATIHTNPGCSLPTTNANVLAISGTVVGGMDCGAAATGNQGCGIRASTSNSFGTGFNAIGGGTYAMQWDDSGISVFYFPRGSEPGDLTSDVPQPQTWGTPQARWPASTGDWASGVWNSAGIPGQAQSCAQRTGYSTCEAFVRANGAAMAQAYWEVQYVKIYQYQG